MYEARKELNREQVLIDIHDTRKKKKLKKIDMKIPFSVRLTYNEFFQFA